MYKFTYSFNNKEHGSHKSLHDIFKKYGVPNTYVEIGVFEGSTIFHVSDSYTEYNPGLKLYGIDPHTGSEDMDEKGDDTFKIFAHNLNYHKFKNVQLIRKNSTGGLIELFNNGVRAEVIYVDGDHTASQVMTDLVLAWQLLLPGGIILCDDCGGWKFKDKHGVESAQYSPRMAVEFFIQCNWHKLDILDLRDPYQVAFKKR